MRDKVICMICIVPAILSTLITTAKLSLVSFVLLFITGFYISYINRYHRLPHISARVALRFLLMFCFLILIFYITFVFRLNNTVLNPAKIIIGKLAIYMFGHVQGFDVWFTTQMPYQEKLGLGTNTFMAISSKLGLTTKHQGIYEFLPESVTNVYSPFRGIIEDYGVIGGFFIEAILFLILILLLEKLVTDENNSVLLQTLAASQVFYFLFVFISYWVYSTYIITFIIFAIFLLLTYRIKITPRIKFVV